MTPREAELEGRVRSLEETVGILRDELATAGVKRQDAEARLLVRERQGFRDGWFEATAAAGVDRSPYKIEVDAWKAWIARYRRLHQAPETPREVTSCADSAMD